MADSEKYFTKVVDGQLSVATVSQSGEIIPEESRPGDVYTTALVDTDNGPQLCVKTFDLNGGGGGGGTVDQTYDATSTNAQSGTAVAQAVAPALKNTATGTNSLTILGTPTSKVSAINIGTDASANSNSSIAIGNAVCVASSSIAIGPYAFASGSNSIAIGGENHGCRAQGAQSIQLGDGANKTAKTLQVFAFQLLDGNTGYIPADRINMLTRAWDLSSSNYLEGKTTFDFESASTMEFFLHFTTNSYFSDNFMFSLIDYESTGGGFDIATKSSGKLWISQANVGSSGWAYDGSLGDLSVNTEYWFKMTFDGSVYTYLLSTDENFTNPTTSTYSSSAKIKNSTAKPRFGSVIRSGVSSSTSQYTNYISDCYLKLGNTKVFEGKKGSQYNIIGNPSLLTTLN